MFQDMNRSIKIIIGVTAAFVLIMTAGIALMAMVNSDRPADYEKYGLGEDVSVEVDDKGDVYLIRRNKAASLTFVISFTRFSSGERKAGIFTHEKKDMQEAVGYGIELEVNRFLDTFGSIIPSRKSKTFLFSTQDYPKIKEVFYYDENTGMEYPLWNK